MASGIKRAFPNNFRVTKAKDKKKCFSEAVSKYISRNFDIGLAEELGLSGVQRMAAMFKIDINGKVTEVQVRAQNPELQKEFERTLKGLPQNTDYYIRVWSNASSGDFDICLTDQTPSATVAAGTGGSCTSATAVTISAANGNNDPWVPFVIGDNPLTGAVFKRLIRSPETIVGSWTIETAEGYDLLVFGDDGTYNYLSTGHASNNQLEWGEYIYDSETGGLSITVKRDFNQAAGFANSTDGVDVVVSVTVAFTDGANLSLTLPNTSILSAKANMTLLLGEYMFPQIDAATYSYNTGESGSLSVSIDGIVTLSDSPSGPIAIYANNEDVVFNPDSVSEFDLARDAAVYTNALVDYWPADAVVYQYLPSLTVPAGTINDVVAIVWLDKNVTVNAGNQSIRDIWAPMSTYAVTDIDFYAKGVGLVRQISVNSTTGAIEHDSQLTATSIDLNGASSDLASQKIFSYEFLAGKTFYDVWRGNADTNGDTQTDSNDTQSVARMIFSSDGHTVSFEGIYGDNHPLTTGITVNVDDNGRIWMGDVEENSRFAINIYGSTEDYLEVVYTENDIFDNVDWFYLDEAKALAQAAVRPDNMKPVFLEAQLSSNPLHLVYEEGGVHYLKLIELDGVGGFYEQGTAEGGNYSLSGTGVLTLNYTFNITETKYLGFVGSYLGEINQSASSGLFACFVDSSTVANNCETANVIVFDDGFEASAYVASENGGIGSLECWYDSGWDDFNDKPLNFNSITDFKAVIASCHADRAPTGLTSFTSADFANQALYSDDTYYAFDATGATATLTDYGDDGVLGTADDETYYAVISMYDSEIIRFDYSATQGGVLIGTELMRYVTTDNFLGDDVLLFRALWEEFSWAESDGDVNDEGHSGAEIWTFEFSENSGFDWDAYWATDP